MDRGSDTKKYVMSVARTILSQILAYIPLSVYGSWGVRELSALRMDVAGRGEGYRMAGLALDVDGFQYTGRVVVLLDEAMDYYLVLAYRPDGTAFTVYRDVSFDQLGELLDLFIEKGDMTDKEYGKRVERIYSE
jgi:hypothetical protein